MGTVRRILGALLGEGFRVLGVEFDSNYGRSFLFPAPKSSPAIGDAQSQQE